MARLIPLNTVYITYEPSTAPTVTRLYYGALIGVARDLHDLPTTDNGGHYNAVASNTMVVDPTDTSSAYLLKGNHQIDTSAVESAKILEAGVTGDDLDNLVLTGVDYSNSDGGKLYYTITGTDPFTLNIYKAYPTGATSLVAQSAAATASATDIVISTKNNSGIAGTVDFTAAIATVSEAANTYIDCLVTREEDIEPYEYPEYKTGNLIDTDTVSVYAKDAKYIPFVQTAVGGSPDYRLLPVQQSNKYDAFTLISVNSTDESVVHSSSDFTLTSDTFAIDFGAPILPGSLAITIGHDKTAVSAWSQPATPSVGDVVKDAGGTNFFVCTVSGAVGGSEPAWDTVAVGNTTTDNAATWMYLGTETTQTYVDVPADTSSAITGALRLLADAGDTTAVTTASDRFGFGTLTNVKIDYLTGIVNFDVTTPDYFNFAATENDSTAYCKSFEFITDTTVTNNLLKYIQKGDKLAITTTVHAGDTGADGSAAVDLSYATASTRNFSVNTIKTAIIDSDYLTTFEGNNNKYLNINQALDTYTVETQNGSTITLNNVLVTEANTFFTQSTNTHNLAPVPYFAFIMDEEGVYTELELESGIIDITTSGSELVKGTLDFDNEEINLATVSRTAFTGTIVPAVSTTFSSMGNFVCGDLYIEYEAEIRNASYLNAVTEYNSDLTDIDENAPLGPVDPRNKLGYAAYLVNMIAPTSTFYVMPVTSETTGLSDGLNILTNYRDILHVAHVDDSFSETLDNWIDPNVTGSENSPEIARFRIGYSTAELKTQIDRVLDSQSIGGTVYTVTGGYTRFVASTATIDFESTYSVAAGDTAVVTYNDTTTGTFTVSDVSNNVVTFSAIGTSDTTTAVTSIAIYKTLSSSNDIADYMASIQNSTNSYMTKILMEGVPFTYDRADTGAENTITLTRDFGVIFPFALQISTPPHQPNTFVTFENYGFGLVQDSSNLFSRSDFETMVAAGYYIMTNDLGTAPYCLRDVTCGVSGTNGELGGCLSKVTPVVLYAKEIWDITRDFLGKYNVVSDVINMLSLKLNALANKYTTSKYQYLGTLLYDATNPTITEIPNGVKVEYTVRPQDAFIEINNYITVQEKNS